jgi:hypothetical protein
MRNYRPCLDPRRGRMMCAGARSLRVRASLTTRNMRAGVQPERTSQRVNRVLRVNSPPWREVGGLDADTGSKSLWSEILCKTLRQVLPSHTNRMVGRGAMGDLGGLFDPRSMQGAILTERALVRVGCRRPVGVKSEMSGRSSPLATSRIGSILTSTGENWRALATEKRQMAK